MKITQRQLRQIIREELSRNMNESDYALSYDDAVYREEGRLGLR